MTTTAALGTTKLPTSPGKSVAMNRVQSLIGARLNAEWRSMMLDANPWPDGPFEHCHCLAEVVEAANHDDAAAWLVERCQGGDELAGRVLIQALLPRLVRLAKQDTHRLLDDYVATAWLRIASFPNSRRHAVLTNISMDCLKSLSRSQQIPECPTAQVPEPFTQVTQEPSSADVIETSRLLRLVTDDTAAILRSFYSDGLSGRETAARHGLSENAVRYRCSAAVSRMRANAAKLAAA